MQIRIALAISLALLASCTLGPDYRTAEPELPNHWQTRLPVATDAAATEQWWQQLHDPLLTELVTTALANNLDALAALSRLRQARAQRTTTASALYPALDLGIGGAETHTTRDSGKTYTANLDAFWELDVFGGNRRDLEAAEADIAATEAELGDILVSLAAETALTYLDIRVYQQRINTTQENLKLQEDNFNLARWRNQAGLATELDVEQARYSLEQTRAQLPPLESARQKALDTLAVLLGQLPGNLPKDIYQPADLPAVPASLWVGVPAEALRQRADVRRAERQLAAQTARIGVAKAAFFPSLSLSGSIGVESLHARDLFNGTDPVSMLAANIASPLFQGGRLRANLDIQNELQQQALFNYQQTLLTAVADVEAALVDYDREFQRQAALQRATAAAANASELARQQYQAGLVDFLVVLNSQQVLLSLRDSLEQSNGDIVANLVRLYKALGGGWQSLANEQQRSPANG